MFVIRQAIPDDVPTLLKLAKMVYSGNLPPDAEVLRDKVHRSRLSFANRIDPELREFIFVLEETDTGNVIGTSSVIAAMGGPGQPLLYLQVRRRQFYSDDLRTGHVHETLQLGADESGPTELGGLILSPAYRGHPERLGAQLSLVRFHFIGLQRDWFSGNIIAELMGPLSPASHNGLWEFLGRRFINLSYEEADRFSRNSKEFITSLFPPEEIYASLLPPEVRNIIGKVGPEAAPARRMLERLGFGFHGRIDPFDGGPYLEADVDKISLITATRSVTLGDPAGKYAADGFVSVTGASGFRAVLSKVAGNGDPVSIPGETAGLLGAQVGDTVGLTPLQSVGEERAIPDEASSGAETR
jgi:arginine N-succinyltransferase